jgi:hypothetical protein
MLRRREGGIALWPHLVATLRRHTGIQPLGGNRRPPSRAERREGIINSRPSHSRNGAGRQGDCQGARGLTTQPQNVSNSIHRRSFPLGRFKRPPWKQ